MDLYTLKEAAAYLGVKPRTMSHYLVMRQLTPVRQVGRNWLFTREELDRFKARPRNPGGRPAHKEKE